MNFSADPHIINNSWNLLNIAQKNETEISIQNSDSLCNSIFTKPSS